MIIPIYGVLTKRPYDDFVETISYEEIYDKICQGLENPNVEEIILDIDSPGGETGGLFDLCDFIYEARSKKPIIAYANDSCFSAGYASSCSKVLVTRTSGVGSIGVIATHVSQSEFNKKEGFNFTTLFKGARKNDLNPNEEISPEAAQNLDLELDRLYQMFVNLVARNRNLPVSKIIETEAGVFYGEDAIADQIHVAKVQEGTEVPTLDIIIFVASDLIFVVALFSIQKFLVSLQYSVASEYLIFDSLHHSAAPI